jgi:hypothetical protein
MRALYRAWLPELNSFFEHIWKAGYGHSEHADLTTSLTTVPVKRVKNAGKLLRLLALFGWMKW